MGLGAMWAGIGSVENILFIGATALGAYLIGMGLDGLFGPKAG